MDDALLIVDGEEFGERYTYMDLFESIEEAQEASAQLGTEWAQNGWRKQGDCWVHGSKWRQKIIVLDEVEYAEQEDVNG
jgi:hypothetical protein